MTDSELIDAYLRYTRTHDEAEFGAWEEVHDRLLESSPEEAWDFLRELIARTPDDLLAYVAAGPLETFLVERGSDCVHLLVRDASKTAGLARALSGVWPQGGRMDVKVWEAIQRLKR